MSDIATALTASIAKDGQTTPTANLPMGGYKHTSVAVAAALTDYARTDQVQNGAFQWLSSVSGADTITASATPTPAAYAAGQTWRFVSSGANTGAVTLNISSLGARAVTKNGSTALSANDIPSGAVVEVTDDGTRLQLKSVNTGLYAKAGALASSGITGAAASGSNSDITSLTALSSISRTGGTAITGTNTNDSAGAGTIGEYIESSVVFASRANATGSAQWFDITNITLTAGDWDITCIADVVLNGATISGGCFIGIGTASGNNSAGLTTGDTSTYVVTPTANYDGVGIIPSKRISLSGSTNYYLKAFANYSAGTPQAFGRICARRRR